MPKKFQGMNTKAVEARARKAAAVAAVQEAKQKAADDEYWRDDNKRNNKKLHRKQAQEQKRIDNLNKKKELEDLYQAEEQEMKKISKSASSSSSKTTRADIENAKRKEQQQKLLKVEQEKLRQKNIVVQDKVSKNVNKILTEEQIDGTIQARSVEEAISALSTFEELDKHPERRMKAAYKKYEQEQLTLLKAEHPSMRMSQLKQLIYKQWQKSPENPFNQKHQTYNAKS